MNQETENIIEEYISKAPKSIQELVASGSWTSEVLKICKQFNLENKKITLLKNEVLFVLIGLEPRKDFIENIIRELEIYPSTAEQIKEEIEKNIFSKVAKELEALGEEPEPKEVGNQSKVGSSFEEIILNQARAMRPAVQDSGRIMNQELGIKNEKEGIPKRYSNDNDPYRESIG